jgi:hypothetical protein
MKSLLVFLACFLTIALAQTALAQNYTVETTITQNPSGSALIEVRTDPDMRTGGEMRFVLYRTDNDARTFDARVVPPLERGLYRLEYPLTKGSWEIQLRFGTGIELYETWISFYSEPTAPPQNFRTMFYGSLDPNTPRYVQPLGFAIFALMLAIALTLVITILRWLKRQQGKELNVANRNQ